jgi:predicted Fe-Mo cluster-binding NifX family protein
LIAEKGADIVVSGRYGPKAFSALQAAGIKAYIAGDGTVRGVLQQFLDGQLEMASAATGPEMHARGR